MTLKSHYTQVFNIALFSVPLASSGSHGQRQLEGSTLATASGKAQGVMSIQLPSVCSWGSETAYFRI